MLQCHLTRASNQNISASERSRLLKKILKIDLEMRFEDSSAEESVAVIHLSSLFLDQNRRVRL